MLRKFLERGVPTEDIEDMMNIDTPTLRHFIEEIKEEDGDNYNYLVNWS